MKIITKFGFFDKHSLTGKVSNCGFEACGFDSHCLSIKLIIIELPQI